MITEQDRIIIALSFWAVFLLSLFFVGIIEQKIIKMKNKKKKVVRKKITHKYAKIDLCDYLTTNMTQEFIGQRKAIINQLAKM